MAIKNMTTRIPRAGKIRLGSKKGANSPGRNLNYFRVDTVLFDETTLKERLGENPTELRIKFPRIDKNNEKRSMEFIFDASYKAYKQGKMFCKGDGETAIRSIAKGNQEEVPCTCEYLTGRQPLCKQRGELKVILCNLPFLGYFEIGTSSWNSITSIQSVIDTYKEVLGDKFWITEFILFKEEAMLQGHKQYIMRMKIASDFIKMMPTGSEVNAVMMFEDEEQDEPPPIEVPTVSDSVADDSPSETSEPSRMETYVPTSEQLNTEQPAADVSETKADASGMPPVESMPDPEPAPPPSSAPPQQTTEALPPVQRSDVPPVESMPPETPPVSVQSGASKATSQDIPPPTANEVPEPKQKKSEPVAAAESQPPYTSTDGGKPSASATTASHSDEPKRNITPQRRMKEQRLINALNDFRKVGNFPETDTTDDLCKLFVHKTIAELEEPKLQTTLAMVLDAVKKGKAPFSTDELLSEEDIPF